MYIYIYICMFIRLYVYICICVLIIIQTLKARRRARSPKIRNPKLQVASALAAMMSAVGGLQRSVASLEAEGAQGYGLAGFRI